MVVAWLVVLTPIVLAFCRGEVMTGAGLELALWVWCVAGVLLWDEERVLVRVGDDGCVVDFLLAGVPAAWLDGAGVPAGFVVVWQLATTLWTGPIPGGSIWDGGVPGGALTLNVSTVPF